MPSRPIPIDRLTDLQDVPDRGLTTAEGVERRARFGANDVVIAPPSTWTRLVRDTARDPMIWFRVGVAVLFTAIGDYTEAAVLAVAIVPLAGMDAWLHRRTQVSTQGLATRLAAQATVLRNGRASTVPEPATMASMVPISNRESGVNPNTALTPPRYGSKRVPPPARINLASISGC